ncbi:translation elongation factor Ts [bacterium]|jgi:elongation factor Ts|nr:translation elongation factor Ts [bacterium]MBT5015297.1 translation elongation factor Ts [bacterium]
MSKVSMDLIQKLRDKTGLGMMDCKKALVAADGDINKAIEELRKRGAAVASKRAGKDTAEGLVHSYIHPGSNLGVLIEINCETDFVARLDDVRNFAQDMCMQIAALKPSFLAPEDVDPAFLEKEKEILKEQLAASGKPEKIIDQIIAGKVNKIYSEICLLKQSYVKDDKKSVEDVIQELIARTGENIKIKNFARLEIGAE